MTQQDDDQDIQHQFAQLQAEMKRVMAEPAPRPASARVDDSGERLTRAVQRNSEAIDAMALRLDALASRRPARWPVPLAILLGALAIAVAVLLTVPGRTQRLIDLFDATLFPPKPHADNTTPPPPEPPPPTPARMDIAEATPPPPPPPPPAAEAPAPPTVAVAIAEPPAPAAHARIVLRAKTESWIEVRNRQGGTLIARLLRDGDTWAVPDQPGLVLSTGNAGGLELLVDGSLAPSLGGAGVVRRDVPLDADLVRAGRYAGSPHRA